MTFLSFIMGIPIPKKISFTLEWAPSSLHHSPSSWCVPFTECIYVCYDNSYWQLSVEGLACHLGFTYITPLTPCGLVIYFSQFLLLLINSVKILFRNILTYLSWYMVDHKTMQTWASHLVYHDLSISILTHARPAWVEYMSMSPCDKFPRNLKNGMWKIYGFYGSFY